MCSGFGGWAKIRRTRRCLISGRLRAMRSPPPVREPPILTGSRSGGRARASRACPACWSVQTRQTPCTSGSRPYTLPRCGRRDLNPHPRKHRNLNPACLPISPLLLAPRFYARAGCAARGVVIQLVPTRSTGSVSASYSSPPRRSRSPQISTSARPVRLYWRNALPSASPRLRRHRAAERRRWRRARRAPCP